MNLRAHRLRLQLSIDELARRAGVERSKISRAERGYVELQENERQRIAKQVGIRPEELVIHDPMPSQTAPKGEIR